MGEEKNNSEEIPAKEISPLNVPPEEMNKEIADENILQQSLPENDKQQPARNEPEVPELPDNTVEQLSPSQEIVLPPTDNMELHKHPHVHHSKKWKDYLFEFLMLFLAVTAGFFVENKREYYIEHERAEQFSKQLLADLRLDSVMFENWNRNIAGMQNGYDSLLYLLTQKTGAADKDILETLLPLVYVFDVPATTTTYNQMKTSGSLRYIENPELTAHLQDYYDVLLPRSINIAKTSLDYYTENINPFYLKHIRIQDYDPFNDSLINKNPVIMDRGRQTNQELANIIGTYRSLLKIQVITMNDPALREIKETIVLLKQEYGLE